jgi:hypothetical protein
MKSIVMVIAAATLGVTGVSYADERAAVMPRSEDVGTAPSRPLKAVLSDFVGNQSVGSVVWHTDDVAAPGQPRTPAVRADIEIPDLGMALRLELRRNEDETLAASHTVELAFTLPPDFPHGEIAYLPGILMKAGETARGNALNGLSVKVADNFFLFGLSSVEADMKRNIQLIEGRSWIDIRIAYSTGKRADIAVEKATPVQHTLALLETSISQSPGDPLPSGGVKPGPIATPALTSLPQQVRPIWSWPPERSPWAPAPGAPLPRPVLSEAIRIASTTVVSPIALKPPSWLRDISTMPITATTVPLWPRTLPPDFRIPAGPSRFEGPKNLVPPSQFVRWSDRIETVLPMSEWREVDRRCRAILGKSPPSGIVWRGCTRGIAGRCLITRIDDPGVARHELAHCNGWKHPY